MTFLNDYTAALQRSTDSTVVLDKSTVVVDGSTVVIDDSTVVD